MNQTQKRRIAALEAEREGLDSDPALMGLDELLNCAARLCSVGASSDEIARYLRHVSDRDLAGALAGLRETMARHGIAPTMEQTQ